MLWDASAIRGYAVVAAGDPAGTIGDFLYEADTWTIRALIVEAGTWLSSKRLLVPAAAFAGPDAHAQRIMLDWTAAEMAECPIVESGDDGIGWRSLKALENASVEATDGTIGHVADFLIDAGDWRIRYLIINPSDPLSTEKVLVPAQKAVAVDETGSALKLDVTRQFVRDAVHFDPKMTADGVVEESFLTYYGIRFVKA